MAHGDGPERLAACAPLLPHREKKQEETANWFWGLSCLRLEEEEEEAVTVEWREGLVFPPVAWKAPFLQTTFRLTFLFLQHDREEEKKTLFLEKKHLFHHNQCTGELKNQGFFRSWRKVVMISAENYFWSLILVDIQVKSKGVRCQ